MGTAGDGKRILVSWLDEGIFAAKLPEVERLKGVRQPAEYHGEGDAFVHTMLAIEAVSDWMDIRIFWGVLLHDIGKSVTTTFVDGRWKSYGHAEAGAKMTPAVMERVGFADLAYDVGWLVKNHLFHFFWQLTDEKKPTRNQLRFMEHPLFPLLLEVCAADAAASLGKSDKRVQIQRIADLFHVSEKGTGSAGRQNTRHR